MKRTKTTSMRNWMSTNHDLSTYAAFHADSCMQIQCSRMLLVVQLLLLQCRGMVAWDLWLWLFTLQTKQFIIFQLLYASHQFYDVQVYLYTMTNYSTNFTGADPGFTTCKEGLGGWYIVIECALVDHAISCRWGGGGGMRDEGTQTITFILRLWKQCFSSWTLLKMAVQH